MSSRRHLARVVVMQSLFALDVRPGVDIANELQYNIEAVGGAEAVDNDHALLLLDGVCSHRDEIIADIQRSAPQWPIERMDTITRTILFLSVYELLKCKDVPKAVVINEAIELAKEFASEESGKFVNGVLNAIANQGSAA